MRRSVWIFLMLVSVAFLAACSSQKNIVAEFGNNEITYDELETAYVKNLSEEERKSGHVDDGMKDFLELYVNYKMKLRDATVRGFDQDPEIKKEIDDYTSTVGVPYVEEKMIIEPGLKRLYERRKTEKRVSHILLRTTPNTEDSLWGVALNLLNKIQNGESFEKLAAEYSEDEFSKADSGDIYWLTAGQTIPEFDEAIYNTQKGEVYPEPIKTKFGYHIMKVTDEQPRKHEIRAQHILAAFKVGDLVDTAAAFEKINLAKSKLEEGDSFEELAKRYSDDPGSKKNGGDLGYFQRRMMVKPFDEVAFSLQPGEVSDIVESRFGFHIIKVNDVKEIPPYEEEKGKLKSIYQRSFYPKDKEAYVNTLKKEYSFRMNNKAYKVLSSRNTNLTFGDSYWRSLTAKEWGDSTLFSIDGENFSVNDFMNEAKDNNSYSKSRMTNGAVELAFNDYVASKLLIKKAFELRNGDTEFSGLMEDYKNGLYIFKLQEDEIWNNISVDTTKLVELYEETKDNYVWPDRAAFNVIFRPDSASIYSDKALLDSGTPFETIVETNEKDRQLQNKTGERFLKSIEGDELAQKAFELSEPGDISDPFKVGNMWYIVKLTEKVPSAQKTFEEAQSEVLGVWQERQTKKLEEEYIKRLRKIYEPELYYDRLSEAQKN